MEDWSAREESNLLSLRAAVLRTARIPTFKRAVVDPRGLAPRSPVCGAGILLLNYGPGVSGVAVSTGVAPAFSALTGQRLHGFGFETLSFGAPCGNRTRIAGVEGRHSAVELKAPISPRTRRGADGSSPPARPPRAVFPARLSEKLLDPSPGVPDGGGSRQQKNPAPFRARGSSESSCRSGHALTPRSVRSLAARPSNVELDPAAMHGR